jgi:septum formation protein
MPKSTSIILASSSQIRKDQLKQLGLPFTAIAPNIDETPKKHEPADQLVLRLSQEKALKVAQTHPEQIIIAADQVQTIGQKIFGKPLNAANAKEQLHQSSNSTTIFYVGVTVHHQQASITKLVTTHVTFKPLTSAMIDQYIKLDQPFQAAGSICIEKRGMWLIHKMTSTDPTAIYGLPTLTLLNLLNELGVDLLSIHSLQ